MADETSDPASGELIPREPSLADVVNLCRELHARGAEFIVIGGFAMRASGLVRHTGDIDLLIDPQPANEARVFDALATLPDGCVRELEAGDVAKFTVVRVADEIVVDLMANASGITFAEARQDVVVIEVDGVNIPFASSELLYRMKKRTHREKDRGDLHFLEQLFAAQGKPPPDTPAPPQ